MKRKARPKAVRRTSSTRGEAQDLLHVERDLAIALAAAPGFDKGLRLCLEAAIHVSGMDCGGVYLRDQVSGDLDLVCHTGVSPAFVRAVSHCDAASANARLVAKGAPVHALFADVRVPKTKAEQQEGLRAIAAIPLRHEGRVIGSLNVASHRVVNMPACARDALETIAAQVGSHLVRLRAAEALRESEEKYKHLIETTNTGYVILDEQGRVTDANQEYVRLTGHRRLDEIVGRAVTEWTAKHDIARNVAEMRKCLSQGVVRNIEIDYAGKTGRITPIEINATVHRSGRAVSILTVCRDVTERRKAEAALRESDERFSKAFRVSPTAMGITALRDGRYIEVNDVGARMFGYERGEVVGHTPLELGIYLDATERDRMVEALRRDGRVINRPMRLRTKSGEIRDVEFSAVPIQVLGAECLLVAAHDVTARKQTEAALRESEERYRTLAEAAQDMIFIIGCDDRVMYVNQFAARSIGKRPEKIMGQPRARFFRGEGSAGQAASLRRIFETGEPFYVERPIDARGRKMWLGTWLTPLRGQDGKVTAVLGISRDMTERKRAEEALRESEEGYRAATELLSDYIFRMRVEADGKAVLESASANFERITGRRLNAVAQPATWLKTIHPEDVPRMAQVLQSLIRDGGTIRSEFRTTVVREGKDVQRWVEVTAKAENDPAASRVVAIVGAVRDITERKRAEEALRHSEQQYRITIDSMDDLIHVVDSDLRIVLANHAFEDWQRRLGIKTAPPGRTVFEVFPFLPATVRGEYERVFATGAPLITEERNTVAGTEFITETRKIPIIEGGKVVRVVTVVRDITAGRRAQERLLQAEKMESLGHLAGGIAHDFNNQLAAMLGYAELLGARLADEELRLFANMIARTAMRSGALTRQLLAFARKGKYQTVPVDVHSLINEVAALLTRTVDKRITIKQVLAANPCITMGDPIQLQNALLNLAINARDAMPDGGELVFATDVVVVDEEHCRAASQHITPGRYVEISVADTGVGMSEETRKRLFEPFFTTKEPGKGTGMGLAAVYGTVANHQGAISVRSEPGRGTTFTIHLPLLDSAPATKPPEAAEGTGTGTAHILLADDEEAVREMTAAGLRHLGYRVTTCADGAEAVGRYRECWREIDLVVLDMVMPKLGGRDALLAMRTVNPAVKALLSSGYTIDGRVQRLVEGGKVGFIQKPFHLGELSKAVAAALRL